MEQSHIKQSNNGFFRLLWGYIGLYTVVNVVAVSFVLLLITRRVRVRGYVSIIPAVLKGNVIVASNHPSSLETLLIPVLFWPLHLLVPRLFAWSVARHDAFPLHMRWLYKPFRCILVGLTGHNKNVAHDMADVLKRKGVLVCYPEATRTCKGKTHWVNGGRKMGTFRSGLPRLATQCGSVVVPIWVDFGKIDTALSLGGCLKRIIFECPMSISCGAPYKVDSAHTSNEQVWELQTRMFAS